MSRRASTIATMPARTGDGTVGIFDLLALLANWCRALLATTAGAIQTATARRGV